MNVLQPIGRIFLAFLATVGRLTMFTGSALSITHDMVSARRIAHRIAMLYEGRIIWVGPTADIDDSGNPYVDQFINSRTEGTIQIAVTALQGTRDPDAAITRR